MKFNRKGKTVFAIALTACMAGMAFSALPLLSVQAVEESKLHSCTNGECDKNGFNPAGPCTTYTYAATKDTTWEELQKAAESVTCTGWTFDGWYTSPLEYTFWGGREKIFAEECKVLFPEDGWKSALEFAEYYTDKDGKFDVTGVKGNLVGNANGENQTTYYFKELFNRWLTRFKTEECQVVSAESKSNCKSDKEIIEQTKKELEEKEVTSQNLSSKLQESVTLYARMKPDTVKVNFYVDRSELNGWNAKAGCYVEYGNLYMTCSSPYGTPLGELFQDVSGLTVTGWRKSTTEDLVKSNTYLWEQRKLCYVWSDQILDENFATRDGNGWKVDLVAILKDENSDETTQKVESEKKAAQDKSAQEKDTPKPEPGDTTEKEHTCGNGTLSFKEATCQETGIKPHFHCSCGKGYWDQNCTQPVNDKEELIAQTHHNLIKIQGKKPTCTEEGKLDRWVCTTCHDTFADAKGENKLDNDTIEALGHDYENGTNGNKVCTRCGNVVASEKKAEPEVKLEDQPQVQPQAQEQPTIEETKKEEAPKPETKQEVKEEEVKKEEVKEETKQETTAPQTPVAPEQDEDEEKDEVVVEREQQTRPSSRRSARA